MNINKETLIQALANAVPGFKPDELWADESLGYLIINDLARYICNRAEYAKYDDDEVRAALDFLEACLLKGDSYVKGLVHECLETLASCSSISEIKKYFGVQTLTMWNQFFEKK